MTVAKRIAELLDRAGLAELPRSVLAAGIVVCVATAAWGWWRWGNTPASPQGTELTASVETPPTASADPSETVIAGLSEEPPPVMLVVHVVGAVLHPGVYELEEGSRVSDAVTLAGGLTGNAAERAVNLARVVVDGEQIAVPTQDELDRGEAPAVSSSGSVASAGTAAAPVASPGLIDINSADAALLETLPGIGPAIAARIVSDREANGPFASPEELLRVSGIGEKKLAAILGLVVVR